MANIQGTSGNDVLVGTVDPDTISGHGGDDVLEGGDGDDSLFGGDGNDSILGGLDNDLLEGGEGNDTLDGGAGTDQLSGGIGDDTMFAYGGDSADGGDGNDTLIVGDGLGTTYNGGSGIDALTLDFALAASGVTTNLNFLWAGVSASIGTATVSGFDIIGGPVVGSAFNDNITIGALYASTVTMNLGGGHDHATGGSSHDTISGGEGNDTLEGLSGNDTLTGGLGDDQLDGGSGDDVLSDSNGSGTLDGGDGDDTVLLGAMTGGSADGGTGTTDRLNFDFAAAGAGMAVSLNFVFGSMSGSVGGVSIAGFEAMALLFNQTTEFADTVTLGAEFDRAMSINLLGGNDTYSGGLGGDYVNGGAGNDTLGGGGGTNTLLGGIGNDSYVVENLTTTLSELAGQGTDTVLASLNWSLADEFENLTLTGFGNIDGYGNAGANVITGNNGNNRVESSDGNDVVHGGNGDDTLYGGGGDDTLNGDGGNDNFEDGVGTNTINGGAGDDYIVFSGDAVNNADGGAGGYDALDIRTYGRTTGFVIDLTGMWAGGSGIVNGGTVTGFEALIGFDGTQWADVINFGAGTAANAGINNAGGGDDILTGTDGNNYIVGGEGNDTIVSGAGTDDLFGGAGNDTIIIGIDTAGTVDGGSGTDTLGFTPTEPGAYTIDFTLLWSGGIGTVNGVAVTGIEVLQTNLIQSDHFVYGLADSVVIGAGYTGSVNLQLGRGADSASGGSGDDIINGEQDNDVIHGGAGNDVLGGSYASDYVYGDAGDDTISGDTLDVEYTWGNDHLYGGDGNDTIEGGAYQDWLYGDGGNDVLRGDSVVLDVSDQGNDLIYGGAGIDQLFGMGGNDLLDGGAGADTMAGGLGNDNYYVDSSADVISEAAGEGADRIFASTSYVLGGGVSIETLSTTNNAGTAAINLTGNELANAVYGNAGVNTLRGGGGDDVLLGLEGDDVLIGGAGADAMTGGLGNDSFYVDSVADAIGESAGQGTDRVFASISYTLAATAAVETLSTDNNAGTAALTLGGNAGANNVYGNAGHNSLYGSGGNDVLLGLDGDDTLNGGTGSDTMTGGFGNDWYYVDSSTDVVSETAGQGTDRIFTRSNYVLATGVSIETVATDNAAGTVAVTLIGNEIANNLYGNAGNNGLYGSSGNDVLIAHAGNDTLNGGAGADSLFGGVGADTFIFANAAGPGLIDTIADYNVADDVIQIDNAVFTGLANGALAAGAFRIGAAAADASDRIVYNSATGALLFDADGNGAGAAVQFATLATGLAMGAGEFVVI